MMKNMQANEAAEEIAMVHFGKMPCFDLIELDYRNSIMKFNDGNDNRRSRHAAGSS